MSGEEAASLADAYAAIEEARELHADARLLIDEASRAVAVARLITHLADLLDGVMADDPAAIRDAAAWLAANRPEVDG